MLPYSRLCGLNMVIVPWPVGMQPPTEGTPMSLKLGIKDHFVTVVIPSTLSASLRLLSEEHASHSQKSNLQQQQKGKTLQEKLRYLCS